MMASGSPSPPHRVTAALNRYAAAITWVSIALIAVSLVLVLRQLPVAGWIQRLQGRLEALGPWGPVVFGACYVIAALLLVPGSALTIAAGALFGALLGTVVVSLAATMTAALAFLIARYLARERIARKARQYPKFAAIDRAISEGGWKIVALLRLSPAVPFTLQNYFYGLTGIHFWPCVLTTWLAMLPGTFLYIYLGSIGRAGAEAASGARSLSPAEWAMTITGLLATVAVTVYVTRLARRALRQHTAIENTQTANKANATEQAAHGGWPWAAISAAILALAGVALAVFVQVDPERFQRLFRPPGGPPRVELREAYADKPDGPTVDHSAFDQLLKKHVSADGWVDYRGLKADAARLDAYLESLAAAPFDDLGRNQKLALLLNAYNACTLRLILDYYPIDSILSIPENKRWVDCRWRIGGHTWSLDDIEHEQVRPKFREPRIHFALVCAAVGCPNLRNQGYRADRLDEQLQDQTQYVHGHDRWFRYEPDRGEVHLPRLYLWYGNDVEQVAGSVLHFAARYVPALQQALDAGRQPKIEWLEYDWSLNSKENAR
jgi:uncharacterized membrane protein YdjX (TVP38/TMEM64 family)